MLESDIEEVMDVLEQLITRVDCLAEERETYRTLFKDGLLVLCAGLIEDEDMVFSYTEELKNQLLQTPENPFSLEQMAKHICISPYHMIRQFKTAVGLTPHQFQIQSRIRKAQKLLKTNKSVTEVALETGFCDQSHFNRYFKKIVGLTPKEYKKAIH